jgi:16S rRNA (uracil1498-N3)-methyltransferase
MKAGERLLLFDGRGHEYEGVIERYIREGAVVKLTETNRIHQNPVAITLFQSLTKADAMDFIMEKATELGVERIVPFSSIRSVVKVPKEKIPAKCARWQKIAREAARKCGRPRIPEVAGIETFDDILRMPRKEGLNLIFWEEEKTTAVKQIFRQEKALQAVTFSVIIGPEGGFAAEEVARAVEQGFTSVSFGRQILKVDTAVMAVLTVIQYERGIFGDVADGGQTA